MSTTFISHRMFVAALNHDHPAPAPAAPQRPKVEASADAPTRPSNQLTVEQLGAFAARYWSEFPFGRSVERSVS